MAAVQTFKVEMTCEGCSGAVERILKRQKPSDVEGFDINLPEKKVTITSALPVEQLTEILKKSGKEVTYIGPQ